MVPCVTLIVDLHHKMTRYLWLFSKRRISQYKKHVGETSPSNFKTFHSISLGRPRDSRGHNDPSHDPVMVGSSGSRYQVLRKVST
jgi:hypothetical protein